MNGDPRRVARPACLAFDVSTRKAEVDIGSLQPYPGPPVVWIDFNELK